MTNSVSFEWYVAQYKPHCHALAKFNLENQNIETFLPLAETTKRRAAKFFTELQPLFPGYIFISLDIKRFRWSSINNTRGITRLLVSNNKPQAIPNNFILALKLRCDEEGIVKKPNILVPGEKVILRKGPFTKMIGLIEQIDTQERITLLLEILGQKAKTSISNDNLEIFN